MSSATQASHNQSTSGYPVEQSNVPPSGQDLRQDGATQDPVLRAHITSLRLLFTAWLTHFKTSGHDRDGKPEYGYIKEQTMERLDKQVLRKILELSVQNGRARDAIGGSAPIWTDMLELLRIAVPSLERRSNAMIAADYNNTPNDGITPTEATPYDERQAAIILKYYQSLLRDLQRLNNILCIARNILTAGSVVQNLAAKLSVDREVCCLVNLCVKTTARGYDGENNTNLEDQWQHVINEFKKLLITCLQFLSNLVTLNERLKLMLWVELFDGGTEGNVTGWHDPAGAVRPGYGRKNTTIDESDEDAWVESATGRLLGGRAATLDDGRNADSDLVARDASRNDTLRLPSPPRSTSRTSVRSRRKSTPDLRKRSPRPPSVYLLWLYEQKENIRAELRNETGKEPAMRDVLTRATSRWENMQEPERLRFQKARRDDLEQWQSECGIAKETPDLIDGHVINHCADDGAKPSSTQDQLGDILSEMAEAADAADGIKSSTFVDAPAYQPSGRASSKLFESNSPSPYPAKSTMDTAEDGIRKLEEGKNGLLRRLEDNAAESLNQTQALVHTRPPEAMNPLPASPIQSPASPVNGHSADSPPEEEEADEELEPEEEEAELESDEPDDESSEEDYDRIPGEEGRGLLTDVPLILGPNEIEVLPMIIMSGIVTDHNQVKQKQAESTPDQLQVFLNMYTIRCHLLLAQENGRNLLRELLIFVAAWDLREEELYFKFMVKIMESILLHGLMPFAYSAFKESKDIISPAQAVIMKLLTKIFHSRQAFIQPQGSVHPPGATLHPATGWGEEATAVQAQDSSSPQEPSNAPDSHDDYGYGPYGMRPPLFTEDTDATPFPSSPNAPFSLSATDPTRTIVSTLFSEFRSNIIPQICALIFLQGQIREGHASIEEFPLNLWDMERMYEGVYQYLEFFAILTDHDEWKDLMADWEVVSELVTLLRELEDGIGKTSRQSLAAANHVLTQALPQGHLEFEEDQDKKDHEELVEHLKRESDKAEAQLAHLKSTREPPPINLDNPQVMALEKARQNIKAHLESKKAPVAVERPYSPLPPPPTTIPGQTSPNSAASPTSPSPPAGGAPASPNAIHEEPADFEWRNLKKLCVLVLSSLVWRNRPLQDQVLKYGGVEVLLRCCEDDEHNPYIREHAIMCLRFLVEGNENVRARVELLDKVHTKHNEWEARAISRQDRFIDEVRAKNGGHDLPESEEEAEIMAAAAAAGESISDVDEPDQADPVRYAAYFAIDSVAVPKEVLDDHGYETYMDGMGKVGLRRKGIPRRRKFAPYYRREEHVAVNGASSVGEPKPSFRAPPYEGENLYADGLGPPSNFNWDGVREVYGGDGGNAVQPTHAELMRTFGPKHDVNFYPINGHQPSRKADHHDDGEDEEEGQDEDEDQDSSGTDEIDFSIPEALRPGPGPNASARAQVRFENARKAQAHAEWSEKVNNTTNDKGKGRADAPAQNNSAVFTTTTLPPLSTLDQAQAKQGAQEIEPRPRTAADLPEWVARITRDLPHKRAQREASAKEQQMDGAK